MGDAGGDGHFGGAAGVAGGTAGGAGTAGSAGTAGTCAAAPSFSQLNSAVFSAECLSCHGPAQSNPMMSPVLVDTQANAEANAARIATAVAAGTMPEGGSLTAAQRQLVADWAACVP
jgi:mono/diheme cytochrome c family protein